MEVRDFKFVKQEIPCVETFSHWYDGKELELNVKVAVSYDPWIIFRYAICPSCKVIFWDSQS